VVTESPAVSLTGISKSYGVVHALSDISLTLAQGEVLGLVGENGAGKSTLIGILSGTVSPDSGEMHISGRRVELGDARKFSDLGVAVVVQEQALVESLRVYENLFLGVEDKIGGRLTTKRRRMRLQAVKVLKDVGLTSISADALVSDLTYPERQLVEIAKVFAKAEIAKERPIILLDEPTSALSENEAELFFALIERWREKAAFIYVSHILSDVLRLSTRLLILKDGQVVDTLPNVGLDDSRLHALMVGRERATDYYHEHEQIVVSADVAPILELDAASCIGKFNDVSLAVRPGEIVGLAGVIGSGKSEVAAAIAGAERIESGQLILDGRQVSRWSVPRAIRAQVLYIPPERATDSIFGNATVRTNIAIGVLDRLRNHLTRLLSLRAEKQLVLELVRVMNIKAVSIGTPTGELSGGNQQKVVFARWLERQCKILVLDDPTRGIDVGTREEIYGVIRQMAQKGMAVILCSESLEELIGLSNRIIVFRNGSVSTEIPAPSNAKPDEVEIVQHMM
jgi:ribose transport system ATP-binding protein